MILGFRCTGIYWEALCTCMYGNDLNEAGNGEHGTDVTIGM